MLRVRLLGELALERDGEVIAPPRGRRLRGLLGWLALHPGLHSRSEVAGRLWPEVLDESARASLRTALADLRRDLGDGYVVANREEVGLAGDVWVDSAAFGALLRDGRADEALALARGPLLDGLVEDWVYEARDRHAELLREALARAADEAEARGDLPAAIARTRERIAVDRLAEDAHRDLIRRLAAAGDRGSALAAYAELRELLRRELGIEPSEPARALVREIRGAAPVLPLPRPLARRHRSPFVGRTAALARLDRALRAGARIVVLAGEPGIGKTRLAAELARAAHARGAHVLYGRADEDAIAPFQPFAEALRPYLAARSPAELGPLAAELGRLVPDARLPAPAAATRDPAGERYRLFEAAAALLAGAAAERPLLLVLDDLHWADQPTLLLVRHLARADVGRVTILAIHREGAPELADLHRAERLARVALTGLEEADVEELVTAWLGRGSPAGSLWSETGGNPFFVEELLRQAWEGGGLGVPESVREVLARRLDGLEAPARDVVLLAAAAGRAVELDTLREASALSPGELADALDAALAAHLLHDEPGRCAFPHALVRDALYGRLSGARRAALHGRLAEALERLGADDAELAHHYRLAGGPREKAVEFSVRAGRHAGARLAYEDAARHFEQALEAERSGPRRGELLLALGEAHLRAGDAEISRARCSEAAAVAREAGDAALLARAALARSGLGATVLGHDPETVALLEAALSELGEGDDALRARLLGRLAVELYHLPPVSRREELSARALELARRAGDAAALADVLSARHVALWSPPHLAERLALADELVAVGDRERGLQGRNWRVLDLLERGDVAAARAEIDEHERLAGELRLPGYEWWAPMWRAMLACLEGRLAESERLRAQAVEIGRRAGDRVAELFSWIQAVYTDLERAPVTAGIDVPDRLAVQAVQSAFRSDLPLIYAELGRTGEARAELDALAADEYAAVNGDMNWLASMSGLALGAALLRAEDRAGELYERLHPYRDRVVLVGRAALCLGPVEMHLGILAAALRRDSLAERHFDAAAEWSDLAGARAWSAWTLVHRAEARAARGEPDASLAAAAQAAAEALGYGRAAARARALTTPS